MIGEQATIREHLEAIVSDATEWTKSEVAHAIGALAILDAAERCLCGCERVHLADRAYRYVPDPVEPCGVRMSGEQSLRSHLEAIRVALTIGERLRADQHAVAALALMDEAVHEARFFNWNLTNEVRVALIPDPGAGSSLPGAPTTKETL